jgi:hypothetical protein
MPAGPNEKLKGKEKLACSVVKLSTRARMEGLSLRFSGFCLPNSYFSEIRFFSV